MEVDISLIEKDMKKVRKKKPEQFEVITRHLHYLQLQGYDVTRPKADKVIGKIYELRPLDYRVLYTYESDKAIALVLFEKETSKIPRRYIDLAEQRRTYFLENLE